MSIYGRRPRTPEEAELFFTYFNVADEIFELAGHHNLTLADIDNRWVQQSRIAAELLGLPWPPYLPHAEEYALDYGTTLDLLRKQKEESK